MASTETRDVVKRYELFHNALLTALRPGGTLASVELKAPCEALLVPRQVSLEAIHIIPFLLAGPERPAVASPLSPPPPLSDLFGEGHDTPDRTKPDKSGAGGANQPRNANKDAKQGTSSSPSASGLHYSAENEAAFRVALTTFLEYHLVHFDGFGNSEFTTLRGQRGAFSDDLDHVKRFGHIGQVAVLADADPLQPAASSNGGGKATSGSSPSPASAPAAAKKEKTYKPNALQIFIIDRPLMDASEVRYIVDTLRKLVRQESAAEKVKARLDALFGGPGLTSGSAGASSGVPNPPPIKSPQQQQQQQQPERSATSDLPFLLKVDSDTRGAEMATGGGANVTARRFSHARPPHASLLDAASDNESIAETVIIDDFEEDVPEEPDLAPYVSKYTRISERQRQQHSGTSRASESTGTDSFAAVAAGRAAASRSPTRPSTTPPPSPPLPGAMVAQVTAHVVGAPPASSTSNSVVASRAESAEGHSTSSRGRVVSVTLTTPAPKTAKAVSSTHTNVLRHQYSRECIKDYRRVVAADNEINYHAFEHLMALRCSAPLAKTMSSYVAKSQQLQQPILNNVKYNKFVDSCHALIAQVPRFAQDVRQQTILFEGIERYVTSRLYHQIYDVCEDERQQNAMLQRKFMQLENMTAEALDALPEVERHHVWGQAMFELDGMDFFKSPREKLRCGMRACELLSLAVGDILRQRRNAKKGAAAAAGGSAGSGGGGGGGVALAFGADEFLPCFLLLTLRARPLNYVQNVSYIEKFRYARLMAAEESYCFATMQSAMLYWLNCREDGRMPSAPPSRHATPTPQTKQFAAAAATEQTKRNAANVEGRTPAAAAAPPPMTERDLLPSVRQASFTARGQAAAASAAASASGAAASDGTVVAQEEAPTVLDVLFGWANRSLAPLADEIGIGSGSRKNTESSGAFSANEAPPLSPQASPNAGPTASPWRVMQALSGTTAAAPRVPSGRDAGTTPLPNGASPTARQVPQPDANTRALVRELLVTQRKSFEQLTLTEIQMIVEEARQLLIEKK